MHERAIRVMAAACERPRTTVGMARNSTFCQRSSAWAISLGRGWLEGGTCSCQIGKEAHDRIDDGWLEVTTWTGFGLADFVRHRRALYDGTHVHLPGTRLDRTRTITATSPAEVLLELDGESVGRLPLSIDLLPGALRLKV